MSIEDKNRIKISSIPAWLEVQLAQWLEKKPTGSAVVTIELNANQGGLGNIVRQFTVKETI